MARQKAGLVLGLFVGVALCQVSLQAFEGQMGAPQMPQLMPTPTPTATQSLNWFSPVTQVWYGWYQPTATPSPAPTVTSTPTPGRAARFVPGAILGVHRIFPAKP